jgi:hypothetical protein
MFHQNNKVKNHNIKLAANESLANVAGSKYFQKVAGQILQDASYISVHNPLSPHLLLITSINTY